MRVITILLLTLLLAACQSTENGQALTPPAGGPAAFRLGAQTFSVADVNAELARAIGAGVADALASGQTREQVEQIVIENDIRAQIFAQMIQDELLLAYARSTGIGLDPVALDAAVFAQQADGVVAAAEAGALRVSLARSQLIYEVVARNTRADMARARHILLPDAASAQATLEALLAGGDFAALAAERSQDTVSAADGGNLGWAPRGEFVAEFEAAVFSAPLGTPQIVQSQFGFHVVEVLERQEQRPFDTFAQLQRARSANEFYEASFLPWYAELRGQAELSGELAIAAGFDPNTLAIPFPETP